MKRYNIYAGLGGGFGGAQYQYTAECDSHEEAEDLAYQEAVEAYNSYEGLHGIKSWYECGEEYCDENDIPTSEMDDYSDDIDELYNEELETWLDYYAVLTDEDTLDPEELDLRWCEDGSPSKADSE